ncbi:MAG: caspase family protein, partial [Bacteroidota bacterium]
MVRYALIIGIEKYDNFRDLGKAYKDAKTLSTILKEHGNYNIFYFPKRLKKDSEIWELASDKRATKKELQEELRVFVRERAKGQEALIYFAGHGFEIDNLSGGGALATSDTTKDKERAITFHDINNLVYQADLSSLVMIIDCCYSGQLLERSIISCSFQSFFSKKDYYFMTGCRPFELAREGSEHGIFTEAILRGLSSKYADEDGRIGTDRLFDFVSKQLRGSGQEPIHLSGGRSINLVSYRKGKSLKLTSTNETCPYQGLKAFEKSQAKFFFGREKLIQEICQKLDFSNFVALIGASGSGKSSLVRAGIIPWLEENRNWNILEPILPGSLPNAELVSLLPDLLSNCSDDNKELKNRLNSWKTSETKRVLIFIDQFEEVFTVCSNQKERSEFLDLVADIIELQNPRLSIILTLRADFVEPCLNYPRLSRLIEKQPSLITPLVGEALERAIRRPALVQGYGISEGLIGELFKDIHKEKECLPLIQFTLTELWKSRDRESKELTAEHYKSLGDQTRSGLIGTLNKHAEKIYWSLKSEHYRDCAEKIFIKLVKAGIDSKDTRQRQLRSKLVNIPREKNITDKDLENLLDILIQGRLLVSGKNQNNDIWIDLVHEALMDGWERFSEWLKDNRLLRRLIARIEDEFLEWGRSNKRNENLLMGGLLLEARESEEDLKANLGVKEFSFYQASDVFSKRKEADELRAKENEKNNIKALKERVDCLNPLVSREPVKGLISILEVANQSSRKLGNKIPKFLLESLSKANLISREKEIFYVRKPLRTVCFDMKDR